MNQNPLVRLIRTIFTRRTPAVIAGLVLFIALLVIEGVGITRWIHNSTTTALTALTLPLVEKEPQPPTNTTVPSVMIGADDSGLKRHAPMTNVTALHQWQTIEGGDVAQTPKEKMGIIIDSPIGIPESLNSNAETEVQGDGVVPSVAEGTSSSATGFDDNGMTDNSNSAGSTQTSAPPVAAPEAPVVPPTAPPPPAVQQPVATATTVPLPTTIPTQAPPPPPAPTEPPPPPPPPTEVPPPPPPAPTEAPPPPPPSGDDNGDDDDDDDGDDDNDDDDDGDDEDDN